MPPDAAATLLALLASPSLWTLTSLNPPTICQAADPIGLIVGSICLVRRKNEVLITLLQDGQVRVTVLPEPAAAVVWNEATLRVADAELLRRDREQREEDGRRR